MTITNIFLKNLNKALTEKPQLLTNLGVIGIIVTIAASIGLGAGIPLAIPAAIKSAICITGIITGLIFTITFFYYKIILKKPERIQPTSPPSVSTNAFQRFTKAVLEKEIKQGQELLNQPELKVLKELLLITPTEEQSHLFHCLHVLLGLKPILAIERGHLLDKNLTLIKKIISLNPHCSLYVSENQTSYFINEKPLERFDPKRYILQEKFHYKSYLEAIQDNFYLDNRNGEAIIKLQYVSYLLGFGPTWEAYIRQSGSRFREQLNQEKNPKKSWIFSPLHYQELSYGLKAINHLITSGKKYSFFLKTPSKAHYLQKEPINKLIDEIGTALYWHQVVDPLSLHTPYIQDSLYYRHNLIQITSCLLPNKPLSKEALDLFQKD